MNNYGRVSRFGETDQFICVSTGGDPRLTLYKSYEGFLFPSALTIMVVADDGLEKTWKSERFMKLSEFRELKLKQIGI